MIRLAALSVALLFAGLAPGEAAAETPRQLSGAEISAVTQKSLDALRACYVKYTARSKKASGKVRFDLIVHRDGTPWRLDVETPGVESKRLSACLVGVAERWRFPERRGFTRARVPFLFLRTHAAGAGPQHSCWRASGCKSRRPASARDESPRSAKRAD